MAKHLSKFQRAQILRWHSREGASVTATCKRFGISRATFYRWQARWDSERPYASLNDHSQRPDTVRVPEWSDHDLVRVGTLTMHHPTLGRRRIHQFLLQDGFRWSEATVGRMLTIVRKQCPVCGVREGHNEVGHVMFSTFRRIKSVPYGTRLHGNATKTGRIRATQHQKRKRRATKAE